MRERVKKLWLDALRSGEYKQTTEALHKPTGFCCLGVLCDVYQKEMTKQKKKKLETKVNQSYGYTSYGGNDQVPPFRVMYWAGLNSQNPEINDPELGQFNTLAQINDNGKSFEEIADLIEKYL